MPFYVKMHIFVTYKTSYGFETEKMVKVPSRLKHIQDLSAFLRSKLDIRDGKELVLAIGDYEFEPEEEIEMTVSPMMRLSFRQKLEKNVDIIQIRKHEEEENKGKTEMMEEEKPLFEEEKETEAKLAFHKENEDFLNKFECQNTIEIPESRILGQEMKKTPHLATSKPEETSTHKCLEEHLSQEIPPIRNEPIPNETLSSKDEEISYSSMSSWSSSVCSESSESSSTSSTRLSDLFPKINWQPRSVQPRAIRGRGRQGATIEMRKTVNLEILLKKKLKTNKVSLMEVENE